MPFFKIIYTPAENKILKKISFSKNSPKSYSSFFLYWKEKKKQKKKSSRLPFFCTAMYYTDGSVTAIRLHITKIPRRGYRQLVCRDTVLFWMLNWGERSAAACYPWASLPSPFPLGDGLGIDPYGFHAAKSCKSDFSHYNQKRNNRPRTAKLGQLFLK